MMRLAQKETRSPERLTRQLPMHHCSPIVQREATVIIESDASLKGWDANCSGMRAGGVWTVTEAQCHINFLELKTAFLAVQSFLKQQSGISN